MAKWIENQAGEWYLPLHPQRPMDHLRVWEPRPGEWVGSLVLDGDYDREGVSVGPVDDAEEAKRLLLALAVPYLRTLAAAVS